MDKKVVLAYCGGQSTAALLRLLQSVAAQSDSEFGYYVPTPPSRAACAQTAFVFIGAQSACKQMLPESADVLVALEEMEARRNIHYLSQDGTVVLCASHRLPMAVAVGTVGYPTDVLYRLVAEKRKVWQIKRTDITDAYIGATILRALGLDKTDAADLLQQVGLDLTEQALQAVYDKTYSS